MAYNKRVWGSDEVITKEALNNIENGIEAVEQNIPKLVSQLTNDAGYITEHLDLSNYAEKDELHEHNNKDILDGINLVRIQAWDNAAVGGNVNLSNYVTKETFEEFVNNSTEHVFITEAEYEALSEEDKNREDVLYLITDGENVVIDFNSIDNRVKALEEVEHVSLEQHNTLLERVDSVDSQLTHIAIDVLNYGAKGDGVTDDSEAIQKAINSLPYDDNLKIVMFPQGYVFKCNVEVNKPHLVITGGGTITGKLLININNSYANLHIKDLSFKDGGGVEYRTCRGGSLSRCTFHDTDVAIKMKANEESEDQSIARLRIEHNSFENTNYDLLCHSVENNAISIADIHFINNMCKWASISHIDIATMDGAVISGNTFFCARGVETHHHIIVREWSNWFIITNNNLFESGHESIYLIGSSNYNINNNNFAWCGRYIRCAAIKIEGLTEDHLSYGTINGNNINVPSNTGVEVISSSYINIKNNTIFLNETQTGFKGTESLNLDKFYGVYTDDISNSISVDNLINKAHRHRNPSSVHFTINKYSYVDLDTVTSIDGNYDEIRIKGDSTIESINNGFMGHVVRIYVLAPSVIIKNNSTIFLRGNVDAKLKRRDIIELMYKDGIWIEKNRNEMNSNNVKSLIHSDNGTLSVLNDESIVILENTIDTPITTIEGSYEGQQITIISRGDINKIEHNTNLKNKDANTVLIPNGRSITFINFNDIWYEVGRSF